MSGRLRPGPARQLHRERDRGGARVRSDQAKAAEAVHTVAAVHLLQRAVHRGNGRLDSGAQIRDGVKSVHKRGAPPETDWPYDITKFSEKPPKQAFVDGKKNQAILYQRLTPTLSQLKGCLASGFPFIFGFTVYESFESPAVAKSGQLPMPKADEQQLGGHAVLAVGYQEPDQTFIVRNSSSANWGMKGYFTMPYPYLLQPTLSSDFWTIRSVE